LLEGKRVFTLSYVKSTGREIELEDEHRVLKYRKFLPAGPTFNAEGEKTGQRKQDLIQFIAEQGGTRTVAVADIYDIKQ
jgi:hypothetical protein